MGVHRIVYERGIKRARPTKHFFLRSRAHQKTAAWRDRIGKIKCKRPRLVFEK
jgi:hypothetical protein